MSNETPRDVANSLAAPVALAQTCGIPAWLDSRGGLARPGFRLQCSPGLVVAAYVGLPAAPPLLPELHRQCGVDLACHLAHNAVFGEEPPSEPALVAEACVPASGFRVGAGRPRGAPSNA